MHKWSILVIALMIIPLASAATYYVSNAGNDAATGTSDVTAWKTVSKVRNMSASLNFGDKVLYNMSNTWRETYVGNRSGIYYGYFGTGTKPRFIGSMNASSTDCWQNTTAVVWKLNATSCNYTTGIEVFFFNTSEDPQFGTKRIANVMTREYEYIYNSSGLFVYSANGNPATYWNGIEIPYMQSTASYPYAFWSFTTAATNVTIDGLEFDYTIGKYNDADGSTIGVQVPNGQPANLTIMNCDLKYSYQKGIAVWGNDDGTSRMVNIINNTEYKVGVRGANSTGNAAGENIWISKVSYTNVTGNLLNGTTNVGINLFNSQYVNMSNNTVVDYELKYYNSSQGGHALYFDGLNLSTISNNFVRNVGRGISINAEQTGKTSNYNNITYNVLVDAGYAIDIYNNNGQNNIKNTIADHNTIIRYTLTAGSTRSVIVQYTNNFTFTNNMIIDNYTGSGYLMSYDNNIGILNSNYNIFNSTNNQLFEVNFSDKTTAQWKAYGYDANSQLSRPTFVNQATYDFRPLTGDFTCTADSSGGVVGALPCGTAQQAANMVGNIITMGNNFWSFGNGVYRF